MKPAELHRLASIGAEARLQELEQERAAIFRAFPSLRGPTHTSISDVTSDGDSRAASAPRRGRRNMSREARERIAAAQRKRWAALKAQQRTESDAGASGGGGARKKK